MSAYLLIDIWIIIGPLLLSLNPRFRFDHHLKPLLFSIAVVGAIFIAWDSLVTWRGDWSFNTGFVYPIRCLNLPLEELLFFMVVPFSCLFLYRGLQKYLPPKPISYPTTYNYLLALFFIGLAWIWQARVYTALVMLAVGLLFILQATYFKKTFEQLSYWIWLGMVTGLFLIFNYYLTAGPIVIYNPEAILNLRLLTIPIEDLFYNYLLLTLYLDFYLLAKNNFL